MMPTRLPLQCWVRARNIRIGDYYHDCGIVVTRYHGPEPEGKTAYIKVRFNHPKDGCKASFHPDSLIEVWR